MKTVAYYMLHYGKEWLHHSMRSIADHVDEICVFYTSTPSHGHGTQLQNPDTREELYDITKAFDVYWHDTPGFHWEGEHKDFAVNTCIDTHKADIVLAVDADEIWHPDHLEECLEVAMEGDCRHYRVEFMHFWRSLKWVCHDAAMPIRLHCFHHDRKLEEYYITCVADGIRLKVYHMGYAQSPSITQYKQDIHGHKDQWRIGWFENTFLPWEPGMNDVHPTNVDFWNPVPFDDDGMLQYLVGDHLYWDLDIIE
jgi:hypothetical protein